jgi:hypothetical protein
MQLVGKFCLIWLISNLVAATTINRDELKKIQDASYNNILSRNIRSTNETTTDEAAGPFNQQGQLIIIGIAVIGCIIYAVMVISKENVEDENKRNTTVAGSRTTRTFGHS